jgi:RNA polymerase sigma-70 factor (ECF subfamily)
VSGNVDHRQRFEAVSIPFMPQLYSTALRLTRNEADASDLVQETYLRAFRTFENFVEGTNARAWMFTILHSVFVNAYHRKRREQLRLVTNQEDLDEAVGLASFARYTADVALAQSDDWREPLEQALAQLPETFRWAVNLVDFQDLSYEEAAAVQDVPVGTVRSRLFRARKLLAAALRPIRERTGQHGPPWRVTGE